MDREHEVLRRLLAALSLVSSVLLVGVAIGAVLAMVFAWIVGSESGG